ncbi:hypothetical protein [Variovorax sp. SRS16]|uniref:hypothetical protein n=1 Tax=Variovorax sp. SRS16 TaxID=282217 RepID=UPI0013A59A0A|nr:hypothetical protein [Variovorax sp. SRS16]
MLGLEEPLVAMGPSSQPESAALEAALAQFNRPSRPPGDFADAARPLAAFLAGHPHSPWRMAMLTDLGIDYYQAGYFSRATAAWAQAWQLGRGATQPQAKALGIAWLRSRARWAASTIAMSAHRIGYRRSRPAMDRRSR